MTIPVEQAAINLASAVVLGSVIGFERQWRNRLAGLRTNTLVALGAASFVVFEALVPDESSPTRIAAQVVSGVGFLGAGVIFREGLNVRGLNTAATLWCSAAVGVLAGAGYVGYAAIATAFVVFVNLLLRPIVSYDRRDHRLQTIDDRRRAVAILTNSATVSSAPKANWRSRSYAARSAANP
jgi:putative Mg2+ transporter-C (MgtC) family protein